MTKAIRTTCAYCGVGCGIVARHEGGRSVSIEGDKAHPANHGKLCSKGTYLGETVGLEGRLLHPMIGQQKASWDEALGTVAHSIRDTIERYGPDAVAFYVSGQLLTEDYYVANKLMKGFIGSGNIDTNSRLCMASAVAAHNRAFGEDVVPCSYEDLESADLIVLLGSNTAWCHPVIWQRIEAARSARGTKLVVIDPRRTETAERADLHIPINADGDVALFNALLAEMKTRGLLDPAFLEARCNVPDGFWDDLDAAAHGIDPAVFAAFADLVADHPRMITAFSMGANQSVGGTDKGNAITNLHLALGRIAKPGAGPFSITGQPNAMGGREVGGLANMLACHLGFAEDELADVRAFWEAPGLASGPGTKAVDMFRAIHDGRIKFLWVMATNPAVSMPDAGFVREALSQCPMVVVSDVMADTDTGKFAHIRLPALGWGEKDGTVTNSERCISRQRAILSAPGEARADWDIMADVGRRLGHAKAFDYRNAASIFREYAAMTQLAAKRGKALDLTQWAECSDDEFEAMEPFTWGGAQPLADRFSHPDGKAKLIAVTPPKARAIDPAFPLILNTGRYRDQWHTMTRTGLSAKLSQHRREPLLEVHPDDAAGAGLSDGGLARVTTAHGASLFRVAMTEAQARGTVFVPMHWTDQTAGGGRTGALIHPLADPVSGQPGFKNVPCALAAVVPDWRGFLVTRDLVKPACLYWTRARIGDGWLYELAGAEGEDATRLLPRGERSEVKDRARGMQRIMVNGAGGELAAALFLTRNGQLPSRDWITRQFAAGDATAFELLAGRPAIPMPEAGPIVCVCKDVGEFAIARAIAGGADSVEAVGEATCAGTNCGSCRPAIARLLEQTETLAKEPAQ